MKVIISGGGTGGHIYPALAIADTIKAKNPDAEILFVGRKDGLESEIIPRYGYPIEFITVGYLKRKLSFHNVKSGLKLLQGLAQSKKILRKFSPDVVIGTGGFVSGPIVYTAARENFPTMLHEQNVYPGLTNKILGKKVDVIAISFEDSKKYFVHPKKMVLTGNPIRKAFREPSESKRKQEKKQILIFGGSGGATKINEGVSWIAENYDRLPYEILAVSGKHHFNGMNETIKHQDIEVVSYLENMPDKMKEADLIISSAGAITITEILATGKPAILIPKAYTAENHQEYNARSIELKGGAIVILEKELTGEKLHREIVRLTEDQHLLKDMGNKNAALAQGETEEDLYKLFESLYNKQELN
ncbi:undecaprenyldiphospho-muramoylpentapeptide beta-N-acetylglucosaminyltransferase [Isachenkonia alkalipeptolytica]|uniref:UDP-N-acetylglucosamine--N-acetylmuramyl-(pentapeptide) pyrophosphoryl-undecaprenol N-acetylglucosamine transferase n=1 Tax=Isachenkonia alkalipeptolytica TaxID=2565777 RepID=A0AA43XM81_9CLOT|nr:undecaprenyldiphospho-muramoylpentapeptide beta-N-acetylglucosaminyltransferase [Isachenkonia alkalipeptolytica]NBG88520.1 undecaprenyldiphospho-muramoylpentapeptide beta-N-acetylglucosaminyltransferase [Isachenkonia alkalipeptolytica]